MIHPDAARVRRIHRFASRQRHPIRPAVSPLPRRPAAGLPAPLRRLFPLLLLPFAALAATLGGAGAVRAGEIQPSIERLLRELETGTAPPAEKAGSPLDAYAPRVDAGGRVMCGIVLRASSAAFDPARWVEAFPGLAVEARSGRVVEARVPAASLRELAARAEVEHVGLRPRPAPLARSEGLDGMRAPDFWPRFGRGEGVRIAVLDVGFSGYHRLLGGDLPSDVKVRSFYRTDLGGTDIGGDGESHGTACAEFVHDVAPEAELYLANAGSLGELEQAVDWLVEEGVEVISHSIGWPAGIGDGSGPVADLVASARARGVVWVNAAGNFARANWSGEWRDEDGDGISEVGDGGTEAIFLPPASAGAQIFVWLLWDEWPVSTGLSFEVDLVDAEGRWLASSEYDWGGSPYAFRPLSFRPTAYTTGLRLQIRSGRGDPEGRRLRIVRLDNDLAEESRVEAGSLAIPADSPDAISVGAYNWRDDERESFSSYGPTLAGVAKPEIMGPDGVQTATTRAGAPPSDFYGTSAACPHVAGAVALLLGAGVRGGLFDSRFGPAEIAELLRREAAPLAGTPSLPSMEGWGRVRLPVERPSAAGAALVVSGYGEPGGPVLLLLRAERPPAPLALFDVLGRHRGEIPPEPASAGNWAFRPAGEVAAALARGRYWAVEPVSGRRAAFFWPGRSRR